MKYVLILVMILSQASFCIAIYLRNYVQNINSRIIVFLFYGSYLIFIFTYLFIFYRLVKYIHLEEETKLLIQLNDIKRKQKEDIEFVIEEEQKNKEKIVKQINDVIQQIDCDIYEQAERSFLEIYDDFKFNYIQTYCDNAYVNAVISNKKSLMDKYKIDFNYQILLPNDLSLDVLVLPTILFNILDNAIQASKEAHKKFIYLKINYTNNFISIYMKNSNYQANNTDLSGMHGYGISIIEDIIQKNEGNYDWNNTDDFFETTLMLKYRGVENNVDRNSGR